MRLVHSLRLQNEQREEYLWRQKHFAIFRALQIIVKTPEIFSKVLNCIFFFKLQGNLLLTGYIW